MASYSANPATGDRGARQKIRSSTTKNDCPPDSRYYALSQARADTFGSRQAARACTFLARRRAAAPAITAGAPPRTISGVRP
jgi:hypothetical protein